MRVRPATVMAGKVEIPAEAFGEGQQVMMIAEEPQTPVRLTAEDEQELLDAFAEVQQGQYVEAGELLQEIRARSVI